MMTSTTSELTEVLNDLIKINYDRIEGYRIAGEDSKKFDIDLHPVFHEMADESRTNVSELTALVRQSGADAESGTTMKGKIYHAWMNIKATFTGKDRKSMLAACEFGEDQAQKAYETALESDAEIDVATREVITSQKARLKKSHDKIKMLRDSSK
ncbi:MAG: PA2169 family four-helix-bundle protein [Ferruginibacter sp.]